MFDLLGLPVCNTGLSLFTIWSRETTGIYMPNDCYSSRSTGYFDDNIPEEEESSVGNIESAVTVVTVANRWRRRQQLQSNEGQKLRKKSATNRKSCTQQSGNTARPKSRYVKTATNVSKIGAFLPTVNIGEEYSNNDLDNHWVRYNEILDKSHRKSNIRRPKCNPSALWGNGRDWRDPPTKEGDWVRIYPLGIKALGKPTLWNEEPPEPHTTMFGDKDIKNIVTNMSKSSKIAKEIFCKHSNLSDDAMNTMLMKNLGLTGIVWLPNK